MASWTLQDAKARFSEVVNNALNGVPQRVSRRGKEAVVILRASEYDALIQPKASLVVFFSSSPHRDVTLETTRSKDRARDVPL